MMYLLLSILFSSILMIIFILFKQFIINTFYAIVVNYFVCVLVSLIFTHNYSIQDFNASWLPLGILLGMFFVSLFFLIGKTTQTMGASVTSVAMKLGYVLPILLAFIYYKETVTTIKVVGIVLTILAVIFTSYKKSENKIQYKLLLFPLIIFLGSGLADSIVQYAKNTYFTRNGDELFVMVTFMSAFCFGVSAAIIKNIKEKTNHFKFKNIVAGIILGVPNYFSIYFLFQAIKVPIWEDSFVFPVNNIGIVILSTILAVLFFKEKLNGFNLLGLVLAVLSIVLLNLPYIIS